MSTILYSAQINVPALKKWTNRLPRELGSTIIAEAIHDLLNGECGTIKSLPFVSRLNARRKHRRRTAATN